jgi:hypothetical protein
LRAEYCLIDTFFEEPANIGAVTPSVRSISGLALIAGVSVSTVSRALTERGYDLRLSRVAPECDFAAGDVGAISEVAAAGEFGVVIPRDMAGADTQSVQFAPKLIIRETA